MRIQINKKHKNSRETKSWSFEKGNKINKPLAGLMGKKTHQKWKTISNTNNLNERKDITTELPTLKG